MDLAKSYTLNFGYQWNKFKKTQFDSYTGTKISENRLRRVLDFLWPRLSEFEVLECGCGPGRFTEVLLRSVKNLVSVDSSDAAGVNAEFFKQSNHQVINSDLLFLDSAKGKYDLVVAIGVIQHTPDSNQTIEKIYEYTKPGGYLVFDHYVFMKSYFSMRLIYRQLLKRLSPQTSYQILMKLSDLFLPLHFKIKNHRFLKIILNRISPFITYYDIYPELSLELQSEWSILDTYDSLTDHYKHFKNHKQIKHLLRKMNAEILRCEYAGNGLEVICRRPLDA